MHSKRRFGLTIAAVAFLIVLSVLAVVSGGEGFKVVPLRDWLRTHAVKLKRDGSSIMLLSFPWDSWKGVDENLRAGDLTVASLASNPNLSIALITVTVCSPVDYTPPAPLPVSNTNAAGPASLTNAVAPTGGTTSIPSNTLLDSFPTIAGEPLTCMPVSAVPTGDSCQPKPGTTYPYPAICAPYILKPFTITQTFHSIDYSCVVTQTSFVATLTVNVTGNSTSPTAVVETSPPTFTDLLTSSTPSTGRVTNSSLPTALLSPFTPNLLSLLGSSPKRFPNGTSSKSITLDDFSRDPSSPQPLHSVTGPLSIQASMTASLSISSLVLQTSEGSVYGGSLIRSIISGATSTSMSAIGRPVGIALPGTGPAGLDSTALQSLSSSAPGAIGSAISTTAATRAISPSNFVTRIGNNLNSTPSADLSVISNAQIPVTSLAGNANPKVSAIFSDAPSLPTLVPSSASNSNSGNTSSTNGPATQSLIPSIFSDDRSVIGSNLPLATSTQGLVSNIVSDIRSVAAGIVPTVNPSQGLTSSVFSNVRSVASVQSITGVVPGLATVTEVLIPSILSVTTSAAGVVLGPSLAPGFASNTNSLAPSVLGSATAVQGQVNGVGSSAVSVLPDVTALAAIVPTVSSEAIIIPRPGSVFNKIVGPPVVGGILREAKSPATSLPSQVRPISSVPSHDGDIPTTLAGDAAHVTTITQRISTVTIYVTKSGEETAK